MARLASAARLALAVAAVAAAGLAAAEPPTPVLDQGQPVDWWFVFKFNAKAFPHCGGSPEAQRTCPFGGTPRPYTNNVYGQQFVYASSSDPVLQKGSGCVGEATTDPLGATFVEVYDQPRFFVIWNDQTYRSPPIKGCSGNSCGAPWGHSKGMLVWDETGEGFVMQVSTPSWPAAGSRNHPRIADGNTLGCVKDNNVMVSQHFFALRLTKDDVTKVLNALENASVVTDPGNAQLVNNGGPAEIQELVARLGTKSDSTSVVAEKLSTGVGLISKPSRLNVPPWQLVSSMLGGVSLRTATWWAKPYIYTTSASKKISCWDDSLAKPGRVEIATSGNWQGTEFGLVGGLGSNFNHAKSGVSISNAKHYSVFGDMNQQGAVAGNCASSQNGRGGLFFVVDSEPLTRSLTALVDGNTAPMAGPK